MTVLALTAEDREALDDELAHIEGALVAAGDDLRSGKPVKSSDIEAIRAAVAIVRKSLGVHPDAAESDTCRHTVIDETCALCWEAMLRPQAEYYGVELRVEHVPESLGPWRVTRITPEDGNATIIGFGETASEAISEARALLQGEA